MKKILLSAGIIVFMSASLALGGTGAFFSDLETSTGNTFTAGAIDLKIDNTSYYNGVLNQGTTWTLTDLTDELFFNFNDLKPGDFGEDTISLHVDTNDAYICADVTLTSNEENGLNEPETDDGDTTSGAGQGELAQNVNFIWWADDGDNVLETDESVISDGPIGNLTLNQPITVALADSQNNIWATTTNSGPLAGNSTEYIGKAWCFGNLSVTPETQDGLGTVGPDQRGAGFTCNGSGLNNTTQTDSLTADITFSAVQSRNNPNFLCVEPEEPPVLQACTPGQQYADASPLFNQGRTKVGAIIVADRSNPSAAFGAPQTSGAPSDVGFPAGSFVSLGFGVSTTSSRSIVLSFVDNVVIDELGPDLKVFEVTGGVYPDEKIKVEVSNDGTNWFVASSTATRDAEIDISPSGLTQAKFVRITDINDPALFSDSVADGYDLDALEALHCRQPLQQ